MAKPLRIIFHIFLSLMLLGMLVSALYCLLMRREFLAENPGIAPYFNTYLGLMLLIVAGSALQLRDRKWGFWISLTALAGIFFVELLADSPWEKILRIPVFALALFWLARRNRFI